MVIAIEDYFTKKNDKDTRLCMNNFLTTLPQSHMPKDIKIVDSLVYEVDSYFKIDKLHLNDMGHRQFKFDIEKSLD